MARLHRPATAPPKRVSAETCTRSKIGSSRWTAELLQARQGLLGRWGFFGRWTAELLQARQGLLGRWSFLGRWTAELLRARQG